MPTRFLEVCSSELLMQSTPKRAPCKQPGHTKAATLLHHPASSLDLIGEKEPPQHTDPSSATALETEAAFLQVWATCTQHTWILWCHFPAVLTVSWQCTYTITELIIPVESLGAYTLHRPHSLPAFQRLSTKWHRKKISVTREDDQYTPHNPAGSVRKQSPGILQPYLSSQIWKGWQLPEKSIDLEGSPSESSQQLHRKKPKWISNKGQQSGVEAGAGHR